MRQATTNMSDQGPREGHDALGDPAGVHQLARNDEERDRKEGERIDADESTGNDAVERQGAFKPRS